MNKFLKLAMIYGIAAMIGGVFYREFTKWNGFSGVTMLGKVHAHLFLLGMFVFLLITLFSLLLPLEKEKTFRIFMKTYNLGLPLTVLMMFVRGIVQVQNLPLSKGMNASISGLAGIGHLLVGLGIILLITAIGKAERIRRSTHENLS